MATENRVRYAKYGAAIPRGDPRLQPVPSAPGSDQQYLHWIAAKSFAELHDAAKKDGLDLRVASGWRPHRFATEAEYNTFVIGRYGSVAEGRRKLAFRSPHHVGLAVDFGTEGLRPVSATHQAQLQTAAHAWLDANAERFGWTPYKAEAWHWEKNIEVSPWKSLPWSFKRAAKWMGGAAVAAAGLYLAFRKPKTVIIETIEVEK